MLCIRTSISSYVNKNFPGPSIYLHRYEIIKSQFRTVILASTENSLKDLYFLQAAHVPKQNKTCRRVRFLLMNIKRCTFHLHNFQVSMLTSKVLLISEISFTSELIGVTFLCLKTQFLLFTYCNRKCFATNVSMPNFYA